jgi:hypothetical protein
MWIGVSAVHLTSFLSSFQDLSVLLDLRESGGFKIKHELRYTHETDLKDAGSPSLLLLRMIFNLASFC